MSEANTKVWQNKLSNGVEYEIHQASGFSNHSEIAIKIGGECVVVVKVSQKRSGLIEALPMCNGKVKIKPPESVSAKKPEDVQVDLLSGVVPQQ